MNADKIEYESISLNPYSYPSRNVYTSPFEIIISSSLEPTIVKVEIKESDKISDTVEEIPIIRRFSYSNFTKKSLVLLLYILILV